MFFNRDVPVMIDHVKDNIEPILRVERTLTVAVLQLIKIIGGNITKELCPALQVAFIPFVVQVHVVSI